MFLQSDRLSLSRLAFGGGKVSVPPDTVPVDGRTCGEDDSEVRCGDEEPPFCFMAGCEAESVLVAPRSVGLNAVSEDMAQVVARSASL
jgi:hypothetical protein